jgi:pimeloyl-ACP methyl ester carboxylesterase
MMKTHSNHIRTMISSLYHEKNSPYRLATYASMSIPDTLVCANRLSGHALYVLTREVDSVDFTWRREDTGEVETLSAVFLEPEDPDFAEDRTDHAVDVFGDGRKLTYSVWMQPESAPVVYLLPGLGAHRLSNSTLALAEVAYSFGTSVVCLSSTMNFEFMQQGSSTPLPGFLPQDSQDAHRALNAVHADLERRRPGHSEGHEEILAGASLGGAQTLHIAAAAEDPACEWLDFDVYVAIDPPVDLRYAARQLDQFYNAPLAFPEDERKERMEAILAKVLHLADGKLKPTEDLPFTRLEAEYLIGLSFRATLQTVLLASQERHDQGILMTERDPLCMAPAFREASEYSFMEYIYGFLIPFRTEQEEGTNFDEAAVERVFEQSDLRFIEKALRGNARVRVFANSNDFLLGPDDRAWLRDVLGEHAYFFDDGGHLGNLHRGRVQEAIRSIVERAGEEAEAIEE